MNFLYPKIARRDLPLMLGLTLTGAAIGGFYGIVHDQITYALGPEYFTRLKFRQFAWANIGLPPRLFASEVGFLATWWVGMIVGWALARIAVPAWPARTAVRRVSIGFLITFSFALISGAAGFLLGWQRKSNPDFSNWDAYLLPLHIQSPETFVLVAYIHNASYLGGLAGLLTAAVWLWRKRRSASEETSRRSGKSPDA